MGDDEQRRDRTDLIDVSDVAGAFDEGLALPESDEVSEELSTHFLPRRTESVVQDASLAERFTALLIDLLFMLPAYFLSAALYRAVAFESAVGPVPCKGFHGMLFHSLFGTVHVIIAILFEGALGITPGKWLCGLNIEKKGGGAVGFMAALLRNLVKPIDLALSVALIGVVALEKSPHHRRLGDLLAGTVVRARREQAAMSAHLTSAMLASGSGRLAALLIDAAFIGAFFIGLVLAMSSNAPLLSLVIAVHAPLLVILFTALPQMLLQTTPGHWIMGHGIFHEDQRRLSPAGALLRTLLWPLNITPAGLLLPFFSPRHQQPGDVAAGSIVVAQRRTWTGFVGLLAALLVAGGTLAAGVQLGGPWWQQAGRPAFLPSFDLTGESVIRYEMAKHDLSIRRFRLSGSPQEAERRPPTFSVGETVYIIFEVDGISLKGQEAWLREDLVVRYPDDAVALKIENIVDFRKKLQKAGPVELSNNVALPDDAEDGRYTLTITIHDMYSQRQLKEQRYFYVSSPEELEEASEPTSPPPPAPSPRSSAPSSPDLPTGWHRQPVEDDEEFQ